MFPLTHRVVTESMIASYATAMAALATYANAEHDARYVPAYKSRMQSVPLNRLCAAV
jgi:hypothetical protein